MVDDPNDFPPYEITLAVTVMGVRVEGAGTHHWRPEALKQATQNLRLALGEAITKAQAEGKAAQAAYLACYKESVPW